MALSYRQSEEGVACCHLLVVEEAVCLRQELVVDHPQWGEVADLQPALRQVAVEVGLLWGVAAVVPQPEPRLLVEVG